MLKGLKGVASYLSRPLRAAIFAIRHSITWPIVIREGIQWGFTIISGTIPSIVNGKSYCLKVIPQVPFWPWRLANLSPICGTLTLLTLTFTILFPSKFYDNITISIIPFSALLDLKETSFDLIRAPSRADFFSEGLIVFPTKIYSS